MKYILHIDTSGEKGIVGLSSKGEWLVERTNLQSREHAASINNMITGVLQEAGIGFGDLSAISVIGGPGSYTGLRVGLATAKGFCYAWDLPLIMHNKLTLLALQHLNSNNQVEAIYSALPARQGEYFISKYRKDGVELVIPGHVMEQELIQLLENDIENRTITGVLSKAMQDIAKEMN
ncbi:MAG: tRNA (adenosine(37)-N6)-threonylcarbamoyltransferase complex dimerization subunit type 1 TsaB, partial [Sphingobacteriales bacterium]